MGHCYFANVILLFVNWDGVCTFDNQLFMHLLLKIIAPE